MFSFLEKNKIYKAIYKNKNIEYFTFIKINDEITHGIDVFTEELYDLKNLNSIINDYKPEEYKHSLKLYSFFKNKKMFLLKDSQELFLDFNLNYILRFFELPDSSLIFQDNIDELIKNNVISKIQSYFSRYIDINHVSVYVNQIKKFRNINDILMFIPKEFLLIKKPFWVDEIKKYGTFNQIYSFSIDDISLCNKFNLNILDSIKNEEEFLNTILIKVKEVKDYQKDFYVEYNKKLLIKRISQSKLTLENEKFLANNENDEELIFEISIIQSELEKIEKDIDLIDYFEYPFWPDLLMPDQSNPFYEDYTDESILEAFKWIRYTCDVTDLNI